MSTEDFVRWKKLDPELKTRVMSFIGIRERSKIAASGKDMSRACIDATLIFPAIRGGKVPEAIGRNFWDLLTLMRFGCIQLRVATRLPAHLCSQIKSIDDMEKIHGLHQEIMGLTMDVYSFWESDYSGMPNSGIYGFVRKSASMNPQLTFLQDSSDYRHWKKHRVHGAFYVVTERPDGTIIIATDLKTVYLVQGITNSVAGVIRQRSKLPAVIQATFLPYKGYLIFDGCMMAGDISSKMAAETKELHKIYAAAADAGTIISSIVLPAGSAAADELDAPAAVPVQLTATQITWQSQIKRLPKMKGSPAGMWVFRRHGYTRASNPENALAVMAGNGKCVLMGAMMSSLHPTADELFDVFCHIVLGTNYNGTIMGVDHRRGTCPTCIAVDEKSALESLRKIMEPTGVTVAYYPPPSEEEEMHHDKVGGCAMCHIPEPVLRGRGGHMKQCAKCNNETYCSRDCQKQHWRVHKKVCGK